ncbi:hypothetical protein EOPP23_12470 [Endozoicomonas sp. OPT23]|uniref:hypothetical protein n=1 Tax=Endozoicomonas sp. OPT23 TaxID=2072845 RepID=UPI00129A68AE|nr:hypothetical protein [Endozoicomonas sp. OPT23]MRI33800.1 hypothetical protein [Endozoicomonas sp. OPT23]
MKKEDKPINEIPDFSISADERPNRRKTTGTTVKRPSPQPPVNKQNKPSSGGGNGFGWILLILVLVLAGGGVWQFKIMQQELAATRAALTQTQNKLSSVTGEVTATGQTIDQSGSALRSELKVVNSEIRKLWDVSNKRNRQWILINKDNVVKALKQSEQADKAADKAAEQAEKAGKAAGKVSSELANLKKGTREMEQLMKSISTEQLASRGEMTVTIESYNNQLETMKSLLSAQKKQLTSFEQQVKEQEQATKSVDAFRRQVNKKLQQLEASVRDLTQPPQKGLGLQ